MAPAERNGRATTWPSRLAGIMLLTLIFFAAVGILPAPFPARRGAERIHRYGCTCCRLLMAIAIGQTMASMALSENAIMLWFPAALGGAAFLNPDDAAGGLRAGLWRPPASSAW